MKLVDILKQPAGSYVWLFQRESSALTDIKSGLRRVHSYLQGQAYQHLKVECHSAVLVNCKDHQSEVVIIINIG